MSNSKLKIIACVSMLIDHIGMILFPEIYIFRMIGRIAMPIFAFFIAEGCRYTRNRLRYFLQVFLLGIVCQIGTTVRELLTGVFDGFSFNILITFTFSIVLCYIYLEFKKAYKEKDKQKSVRYAVLLGVAVLSSYAFLRFTDNVIGVNVYVDYGMRGILLPLFAVIFNDKNKRIISFSIGLIGMTMIMGKGLTTILCSSLSLPLLYYYDGTYGSKKLKYLFYIFYPTHLALLYLIKYLAV